MKKLIRVLKEKETSIDEKKLKKAYKELLVKTREYNEEVESFWSQFKDYLHKQKKHSELEMTNDMCNFSGKWVSQLEDFAE